MKKIVFIVLLSACFGFVCAQSPLIYKSDKFVYTPDSLGNRIPDFSYAGYMAGEKAIPNTSPTIVVPTVTDDATSIIQDAIDYVSSLPLNQNGLRGIVLLSTGDYAIKSSLKITTSGVVLRGCGVGKTRLVATGKDRRTLIRLYGTDDRKMGETHLILDDYVPVNAFSVNITNTSKLKKGDKIYIQRPSEQSWIDKIGTKHFGGGITSLGWKPSATDIYWDRTIVSVEGTKVTFDAPITTALDKAYGGGMLIPYIWNGRISNIGVENLTCISEFDKNNLKDEAHSWTAITMENLQDGWVRNVNFFHFAGSAVYVDNSVKQVTVENCKSLAPVSEIGGERRTSFFTAGQQCLFQRLYAEDGYHDFAVGYCAAGPNAFVQCHSFLPHSFSGAIDRWASGILFDIVNVEGQALSYKNHMQQRQGSGWTAANSVFWQCSASLIECFSPPTAQNWAFGSWSEFSGDGYWQDSNNNINPRSLYYAQKKDRFPDNTEDTGLMPFEGEASSSPKVEVAMELTKQAYAPALTLSEWIDYLDNKNTISVDVASAKIFKQDKKKQPVEMNKPALEVKNGWLVRGDLVQTGGKHDISWWNGSVQPIYLAKTALPHLTRYVPSRVGTGLTDDIDSVAKWMHDRHIIAIDHNYGLWYERRRDDHERIRRINGDVWPPFYEQPFARSGQGTAYDGLSKYDLTKYNDFYWNRLKKFADLADQKGLVLLHQNYFQHNIIEAGAHWADSPWRPANNINNTGFPEPVPYAGDKRIFFAEQFYDITHPVRRELHRKFIRQCLDNFKGNNSVIQLISAEYTGPLHFVEFWLDVIAEWEKQTGEKPLIALSTTKDVQDAILADQVRAKYVDIIDIRYWQHRADGTTYEPKGGQNLAPRQHARLEKVGKVSFQSVYRSVREYRQRFPEKAVMYYAVQYPENAWASFMAQGSLACLPIISDTRFLQAASKMDVVENQTKEGQYVLGNSNTGYIYYTEKSSVTIDLSSEKGTYAAYQVNSKTGEVKDIKRKLKGGGSFNLDVSQNIVWLVKQ